MSRSPCPRPGENRFLMGLPRPDRQRLLAIVEPVPLGFKQVLGEAGQALGHVYFPTTGVVSMLTMLPGDLGIEVATMGPEGVVGVHLAWGVRALPFRFVVQVAGSALRLDAGRFQAEAERSGSVRELVGRYTAALFVQVAQSVACNGLHRVRERCARWLLMTHDRVGTERFPLTQEFFAQMLGVRRASVVEAARQLRRAGLIHYHRGIITIRNRDRLEHACCPCYHLVKREYDRLLPHAP